MGLPEEYLGVNIRHRDSCTASHAHQANRKLLVTMGLTIYRHGDSCTVLHAHQAEGQSKMRGYDDPSKVVEEDKEGKNLEKRCAHSREHINHSLST